MTRVPRAASVFALLALAVIGRAADAIAAPPVILTGVDSPPPATTAGPALASGSAAVTGPAAPAVPTRSWPAAIGESFGTPAFHDMDGDGIREVIAVDRQQTYLFSATGELRPGWPQPTGEVNTTPAVADLDEDGTPEIIVACSGAPPRIRCLHPDGTELPGFPVNLPYLHWLNVTAPAVADVDGDGHLDVGAQCERGVAFFDRFGSPLPGWPYLWTTQQNIAWSAPAVADLDGDGQNEVVVGTNDQYNAGVHVIRTDGTAMPGWPRPTRNIFSSPAVADLDGDGDFEIVVQEGDPTWYGGRMHVWHHDGTYLPGWPRSISDDWEGSRANPAIADLDHDGALEIVTATSDARLHILRIDGSEFPGYPRILPGGSISSPQVIDTNGDGTEEIFLCYYAGGSQWVSGWKLDGRVLGGFPKLLYAGSELDAHSSVHLDDLEGDGDLDLCAQGGTFGTGVVQVYEVTGSAYVPGVTRADWPKIRRDARNTGALPRLDPAGVTAEGWTSPATGRLTCYPNPLRGSRLVHVVVPEGEPGRITISDAAGRLLDSHDASAAAVLDLWIRELRGSTAGPGSYFVRWSPRSGGTAATARIVLLDR